MDRNLSSCRNNVLEFDYMRGRFSDDWVNPRVILVSDDVLEANRAVVAAFGGDLVFVEDDGNPNRTDTQRHLVCHRVPLSRVVEELLVRMRITGTTDLQRNTGLLLQLSKALENDPDEVCSIYRMSGGRRRQRGVDDDGEVTNLYQGEAPVHPRDRRGEVYPGDRNIRGDNEEVAIQIYTLDLTRDGHTVAEDVPVLAVWSRHAWRADGLRKKINRGPEMQSILQPIFDGWGAAYLTEWPCSICRRPGCGPSHLLRGESQRWQGLHSNRSSRHSPVATGTNSP